MDFCRQNGSTPEYILIVGGEGMGKRPIATGDLQAYLNEMCFRFDNRKNPFLFRDTLLKLLQPDHLEYKELIAA